MQRITQTEILETQIADVVEFTTALAKAGRKSGLRHAFAELARLKAQRSPADIRRIESGMVGLQ